MKRLIALFAALVVSVVGAQTVQTTPNLITSGTTHTWYGVTTGTLPSNYMPGGPAPIYDPNTNMVTFSYNTASPGQTMAINQALANVGAGVKINGYTYSYDVRNMNGDDRQPGIDTFTVSQLLRGPANSVLLSSSQYYNTKFEWRTVTGSKTATTPYNLADTSYIQFGISGSDNGYWGGYFGPQIRNVDMRLNYTPDPCSTNPAYSTSCANYNTVTTSPNLLSGTTGTQAYAINTALAQAGANTMIHGFDYGYDYRAAGRSCAVWDLFGFCITGFNYSSASVTTTLTNNTNTTVFTESNTHAGSNNGVSGSYTKAYRLGASSPMATLGTFTMTPTTSGDADITNMFSKAVYTPDPCTANPLISTSCAGYTQAYHDQQCSINTLYAVDCAGYQVAYTMQQCNANPLYSQSCPGYAAAYHNQQCGVNPLYASDCPGYIQAYHNQQCGIDPLFATDCTGYQAAYVTQQCNANPLYSTSCTGYAVAYHDQQCGINPLYANDCSGYTNAYAAQQAAILAAQQAADAAARLAAQQAADRLAAQQASALAAQQAAFAAQCNANQLSSVNCPGYADAYAAQQAAIQQAVFLAQCNANPLSATNCPGYQVALNKKNATDSAIKQSSPIVVVEPVTAVVTASVTVPGISDPIVSAAVSAPSTTSATSPTSVTSVLPQPPSTSTISAAVAPAAPAPAPSAETKQEAKKTESAVAKAVAKGVAAAAKEATATAANAKSMEDQVATQGLVVGLMGYVPGFTAYQNAIVPDALAAQVARQYMKPNVDNRNAQRRLSGASDAKWQEMVESQYKIGDR